jgi:PilZ domain
MEMSTLLTRCDRSYPLVHPKLVAAMILPIAAEAAEGCVAELCEISPAGAKLLVQGPPELASACRVRLESSKLREPLEFPGEIDWARPNPAGDWLVECEFQPRLSDAQFAELLASGLLERRSAVRYPTRIPVQVQWMPGQPRVCGIVRDLSEGGLCLCLVTKEAPPATRDVCVVAPTPQGEVLFEVRIRWTLCVGSNHLIGCQFAHPSDFALLRKLQPTAKEYLHEHSRAGKPSRDRS